MVTQHPDERNFHVFYQLLTASSEKLLSSLHLKRHFKQFAYVKDGPFASQDEHDFNSVVDAPQHTWHVEGIYDTVAATRRHHLARSGCHHPSGNSIRIFWVLPQFTITVVLLLIGHAQPFRQLMVRNYLNLICLSSWWSSVNINVDHFLSLTDPSESSWNVQRWIRKVISSFSLQSTEFSTVLGCFDFGRCHRSHWYQSPENKSFRWPYGIMGTKMIL